MSSEESLSSAREFNFGYSVNAITDTSSACLALPDGVAYFASAWFEAHMTKDTFYSNYGITYFQCSDIPNLPQFDLLFGGYWL
jgi:hypothetical protein